MIRLDSPDFFYLHLCDRLFIGNDGKGFQHHLGKHLLFRGGCHPDQVLIVRCLCTHLIAVLQLGYLHTAFRRAVPLYQPFHRPSCHVLVLADSHCQLAQFHGIAHGKEDRLNNGFLLLLILRWRK